MATLPRLRTRMAAGAAALVCLAEAYAGTLRPDVEQASQRNFAEYLELLRLRNVADVPADIQRNAAFLAASVRAARISRSAGDNAAGRPVVLAELAGATHRQLRQLLFYIHYDGQPVTAEEWSQPIRSSRVVRAAGRREADGRGGHDALQARPLDPELRVFARSASDDKAPIVDAVDGARSARRARQRRRRSPQGDARRRGGDRLAEPCRDDRSGSRRVPRRRARQSRRAGARLRPADARVRQSRHHPNDAHGLRSARAAAQRALR